MIWQPIETAPKDGSKMLLWCPADGGRVAIGRWDDDRYSRRPRPYWSLVGSRTTDSRNRQPTDWMLLPEPPEREPRP